MRLTILVVLLLIPSVAFGQAATWKPKASGSATIVPLSSGGVQYLVEIPASSSLTHAGLTTNGGLLKANGSGLISQTGAGTTTTILHGGTSPTYSSVALGTDVSGTLLAAQFPALTGNVTTTAGSLTTTIGALQVTNAMLAGSIDVATKITGVVPVANGGTGTSTGSITGTTALTFAAGGTNQNVTLTPIGTGSVILNVKVGVNTPIPLSILNVAGASSPDSNGTAIARITTGSGLDTDNALWFGISNGAYSWLQAIQPGTAYRDIVLQPNGGKVGVGMTPVKALDVNGSFRVSGDVQLGDAATDLIGFYDATPVARAAALTYTYSATSDTHSNLTSVTLTDNSGGTSGGATIAVIAAPALLAQAASIASTANAVATLAADINALRVDLDNTKKFLNANSTRIKNIGITQ